MNSVFNKEVISLIKTPPYNKSEYLSLKTIFEDDDFLKNDNPLAVPLGYDRNNKVIVYDFEISGNLLICGSTGFGKSICLHSILTTLYCKNSSETLNVAYIHIMQYEKDLFNDCSLIFNNKIASTIEEIDKIILWLKQELNDRVANGSNQPKIIIAIEQIEGHQYLDLGNGQKDLDYILNTIKNSNKYGIYFIATASRPTEKVISKTVKDNFVNVICFKVAREEDSIAFINQSGAEKLQNHGDAIFKNEEKIIKVQVPFIHNEDMKSIFEVIKNKY